MRFWKVFLVFLQRILWQVGSKRAGQQLIKALGDENYTVRVIAGMSLVQTGRRALPLLRNALSHQNTVEIVIQVLADIGDESVIPMIEPYCESHDLEIVRTANDAIRLLRKGRKV